MKSEKEINKEIKNLANEADGISDFIMQRITHDEIIVKSLTEREIFCRSKYLALLWVLDEK
jgi:hypothetical protein